MPFHRLTPPVYPGGLRGGDDYINNAGGGTPAPTSGALGGGTYAGSYLFGGNEQVTSAALNRAARALAQNCDFLDDAVVALQAVVNGVNTFRTLTTAASLHATTPDATLALNPAASFNLQLPNPALFSGIKTLLFNATGGMSATNTVTLVRFGGEQINGVAANYVLRVPYGIWILVNNGTNWFILPIHSRNAPAPTQSSNFNIDGEYGFYPITTSGGVVQGNLPSPALFKGRTFVLKDVGGALGTNAFTLARNAAESIEGIASNFVWEAPGGVLRVYSDGTNWWFV